MAKIGIYTLFYNSINYGGILQAYALNRVIREADNDCEVLNFNYDYSIDTRSRIKIQLKKGIFSFIKKSCLHVFNKNKFKKYSVLAKGRREAFKEFVDKNIKYSKTYNSKTLKQAADDYEVFVCGSDQVWNCGNFINTAAFFDFVPDDKLKIAYAPSFGKSSISPQAAEIIKPLINRFQFLSAREIQGVKILKELTTKSVSMVVDPVFLLNTSQWDDICSERLINEKYIFCYFLGADENYKKNILELKQKTGFITVTFPFATTEQPLNYDFLSCDVNLPDASPSDFISLIKNAEYVLTDSFHATAFSLIFNKQFYTLKRYNDNDKESMNSRLLSILGLLNLEGRLLDTRESNKIDINNSINYDTIDNQLASFINGSYEYLSNSLNSNPNYLTAERLKNEN